MYCWVLRPIEGNNFTSAGMYDMQLLLVQQHNLILLALSFNISRRVGSAGLKLLFADTTDFSSIYIYPNLLLILVSVCLSYAPFHSQLEID
jgi:hypothetical protein